jgi:AraC-like DNA-binding protein
MSNYRELPPLPALAPYLACFWVQHTPAGGSGLRPRVVPDGCIDIVWIGDAEPHVAGPATRTMIPQLAPDTPIAGARFRTGMASCLLGLPAGELRDDEVPLREVWKFERVTFLVRIEPDDSAEARRGALESALIARLPDAVPADLLVQDGVASLVRDPKLRVRDLSRHLDVSERQLLRRFEAAVGYGPKMLARILRMRTALRAIESVEAGKLDLAALAYTAGYADQAHMTRELSELAGAPPTRLTGSAD